MAGSQTGQDLADAYAAMDVFAFSSQSETQGMVLAEAMAAGVPVVRSMGPACANCERHQRPTAAADASAESLPPRWPSLPRRRSTGAPVAGRVRAPANSAGRCADRLLELYDELVRVITAPGPTPDRGTDCSAGWRSSGTCWWKRPRRWPPLRGNGSDKIRLDAGTSAFDLSSLRGPRGRKRCDSAK